MDKKVKEHKKLVASGKYPAEDVYKFIPMSTKDQAGDVFGRIIVITIYILISSALC